RLANGGPVAIALLGPAAAALAPAAAKFPVATVYTFSDSTLEPYTAGAYVAALVPFIRDKGFLFVIAGHTLESRDFMPRLAERLGSGLAVDVTAFEANGDDVSITRPVLSGKAIATVDVRPRPELMTVRPNAFPAAEVTGSAAIEAVASDAQAAATVILELIKGDGAGKVELSEAEIIVTGGRGIRGPENWGPLRELADALGAALGASRAVVDAGWIEHSHQVGQTGKTVSPKLYIAVGVSGAIQHLAGMSSSKYIVAINNNPDAPIFKIADFGIVGDLFEVVPKLTEAVKAAKGA
ncbi:MAG TPA: electron transfer flavoprotein subunit alpha/FixB family protein, partial [bacterium]|nr:electron transfer flavoprotein subunit alpha/FixB family protein [bacterium]